MIRGFYYSKEFHGEEHFAISVKHRRVGRWPKYEQATIGDTVILWNNDNLIMGKITGDGRIDNTTWTGRFFAYPVEWTDTTPKRTTEDVFPRKNRLVAWNAISNRHEASVQDILGKVVNPDPVPPTRGPLDGYFPAA